jgi:hypothetical protein
MLTRALVLLGMFGILRVRSGQTLKPGPIVEDLSMGIPVKSCLAQG